MKKNNLFKAVGITILVLVLLSWLVPIVYSVFGIKLTGEDTVSTQIGFISIINVILETFSGFGGTILFVLLVGGFYGVLKATGAYDKTINFLSAKASGREKCTLITIIVVMAIISSIAGLDLGLLVVFPLLIGLIVNIGYDKMVALSATLGATIVGMYGSTLSGTMYGTNNTLLGLKKFSQIIPKVVLFVLGLVALIVFVLLYVKRNGLVKTIKVNSENEKDKKLNSKKTLVKKANAKKTNTKVKKSTINKKETKEKAERGVILSLVIIVLLLLVMFLGTTNWGNIFKSNWFETAHTAWTGATVSGFKILDKLFGGVDALGTWTTISRFQNYSVLLIIAMIGLKFVNKTRWEDVFDGFVEGVKSYVVPTILTILACSIFVFVFYNPFLSVVTKNLLTATKEFNVVLTGLYAMINSVFYVDYYYFSNSLLYGVTSIYDDTAVLSVISIMFTNLYSLVMLVAPSSILLLVSLSISDVKYTDWVKFIWKLAVALFLISFIVFTVMVLV